MYLIMQINFNLHASTRFTHIAMLLHILAVISPSFLTVGNVETRSKLKFEVTSDESHVLSLFSARPLISKKPC